MFTDKSDRKEQFINALAEFLTRDLGHRSILLSMQNKEAQEWAKLFGLAGLSGYPTKKEAVQVLRNLL